MNPFDKIEAIYCINLDRRVDRWEQCLEQFRKVGIEDRVIRISAFDWPDRPGFGNHMSHAKALKDAKMRRLSNCLILEDDIEWLEDPLVFLGAAMNELPECWEVLYLGINMDIFTAFQISNHLAKINGGYATHAYLVSSKFFEYLIDLNEVDTNRPNDVRMSQIADVSSFYTVLPMLAGQRNSYSDIMGKPMDSNHVFLDRLKTHLVPNRETIKPNFVTFITPSLGRYSLMSSLDSIVNQSEWNWESIIVFDGIDPTILCGNDHVHLMSCPKRGHAGLVRNAAFDLVDTQWMAFVDDDDTLHEDYVYQLMKHSRDYPDIDLFVFTYVDLSNGNTIPRPNSSQEIKFGNVGISFAIKTSFVRKNNLLFPKVDCEDFHFIDLCKQKGAKHLITGVWTYDVSKRSEWK